MADHFGKVFDGLQRTNSALMEAAAALQQAGTALLHANEALRDTAQAAMDAHGEQEDLRETVARLERLVLEQTQSIRELRDRLNGSAPGISGQDRE
jgi:ABC-type transporter Mla subunit MlaD